MARILLASRADDELRSLDPPVRERLAADLRQLADPPGNLDVTPLRGAKPWWRLRVGDWRAIHRRATDPASQQQVMLIARIIHRSDLERAVQQL